MLNVILITQTRWKKTKQNAIFRENILFIIGIVNVKVKTDMKIKNILSILFVLLCGCCTVEKDKGLVDFVVDYRLVESNSMYATKAVTNEDVLFAIQQTLPATVQLVFKNSAGVSTVVNSGERTKLAADHYSVTGSYIPGSLGDITTDVKFTATPYITFYALLDIVQGLANYTVNGTFCSFALTIYYDETAKGYYNENKEIPFQKYDELGNVYVQGMTSNKEFDILLVPANTKYEETSFRFSGNSNTTKYTFVENGKFYKLHPALKGSSGSVVELGYPEFVEGTVKE